MTNKYLPSTQFIARLILIVIILGLAVGGYELKNYMARNPTQSQKTKLIVKNLNQKDSNNNGIADWEEALWGLDPEKNGDQNKTFILSKRETLTQSAGNVPVATEDLSPNDKLSREFIATLMSLQQSGTLDAEAIKAVSDSVGKQIISQPLPDVYKKEMMNTMSNTTANTKNYYFAVKKLFDIYKDKNIGDELTIINTGLINNDPKAFQVVAEIASSYRAFGKDLLHTPVPANLADINLRLANNYEKTGLAIEGMTNVIDDPMSGMKAIINYKKYNDAIVSDIERLSSNL